MSENIYKFHINSLFLSKNIEIKGALTDFRALSHAIDDHDVLKLKPFKTETISKEIGHRNQHLLKGVHLHFILPDVFLFQEEKTGYIPVFNRWIVVRERGQQQWLIESDYLDKTDQHSQITTLLPIQSITGDTAVLTKDKDIYYQPYRFMGRALSFTGTSLPKSTDTKHYWSHFYEQPLTARAYGLDSFAIFYPNCQSVFGFHDDTGQLDDEYTVYGWYEGSSKVKWEDKESSFADFVKNQKEAFETDNSNPNTLEKKLLKEQTYLFKASAKVADGRKENANQNLKYTLALGNNLRESFNALLANDIKPAEAAKIEETLERAQKNQLFTNYLNAKERYRFQKHEEAFEYQDGGINWIISLEDGKDIPQPTDKMNPAAIANSEAEHYQKLLKKTAYQTLIHRLSKELNQLNTAQAVYDKNTQKLASLQYNLYADWQKFVFVSYYPERSAGIFPHPDDIRAHLLKKAAEIKTVAATTGLLKYKKRADGETIADFLKDLVQQPGEQATAVMTALQTVLQSIGALQLKLKTDKDFEQLSFKINAEPKGRYYVPNEPALMFKSQNPDKDFYPMFMEWEMGLATNKGIKDEAEKNVTKKSYLPDLMNQHFQVDNKKHDFLAKTNQTDEKVYYKGLVLLSSHMTNLIKKQLTDAQISLSNKQEKWAKTIQEKNLKASSPEAKRLKRLKEAIANIKAAIQKIDTQNDAFFGQNLSGFNEALLMRETTVQMPVSDPFLERQYDRGESEANKLVQTINKAIGHQNSSSPNFDLKFNPFRAGFLKPTHVYLIDSFGRFINDVFQEKQLLIAEDFKATKDSKSAFLPPRLVQSSRLVTHWLESTNDEAINNLPIENPICGWVIANNLDQTIMIYDTKGKLLGQIASYNNKVKFVALPEKSIEEGKNQIEFIKNKVLKEFVEQFLKHDLLYFETMRDTINQSLEAIDPASFAQFPQYALFANRPVALVRATIQMETAEAYRLDQAKNALAAEINGDSVTHGYENIQFPVQIGNAHLLDDGVIGYWKKEDTNKFYAAVATLGGQRMKGISPQIEMIRLKRHQDPNYVDCFPKVSLATTTPETITLLMDPRGSLTLTSWILPSSSHQIPPNLFKEALDNMQIIFTATPVISPQRKLHIPLMRDPSFSWEWLYYDKKADKAPKVIAQTLTITEKHFMEGAQIAAGTNNDDPELVALLQKVWKKLIEPPKNCLKPISNTDKFTVHLDQLDLKGTEWETYQPIIRLLLENFGTGIFSPINHTRLGLQEIREGWLQIASAAYRS